MENNTISSEIHVRPGSSSTSSVYHKHSFHHSIIEMDSRETDTENVPSSEYVSGTGQTTLGDLENGKPNPHHEEDKTEQAVGLVPSLNK